MISLHLHSEYSSKDALSKVKDIAKRHKELGEEAFCITDHGVITSFPEAFKVAKEMDMKFIPGSEFYLTPPTDFDLKEKGLKLAEANRILRLKGSSEEEIEEATKIKNFWDNRDCKKNFHITVLANSQDGLENLFRIYSEGNLYYKHRITTESLFNHSEGIVVLSGCFGSELAFYVKSKQLDRAHELIEKYKAAFPGRYYIEIQYHQLEQFEKEAKLGYLNEFDTYQQMMKLAKEHDVPMVVTNDSHYVYKEDQKLHDIYKAMCYHKTEDQQSGDMGFSGSGYHIMTAEELKKLFMSVNYCSEEDFDEMVNNAVKIEKSVAWGIDIPRMKPFADKSKELRALVEAGWEKIRKGTEFAEQSKAQYEFELKVIQDMKFTNYFTNVKLIIDEAYKCNVLVGPGRGSGAGSEVNYLLGITKVDPIKYGLMFERFLNPSRHEMPDIDIDFESIAPGTDMRGPDLVVKSLADKGYFKFNGRIANIATASTLQLFKKLATYFGIPAAFQNKYTTGVNKELLDMDDKPSYHEFKESVVSIGGTWSDAWEKVYNYLDVCYRLDGIVFGSSIHASGVIMTEEESNLPMDTFGVLAFNGRALEEYGYVKYDLLAIDTLNPIHELYGLDIDWEDNIDPEIWKTMSEADTDYVFQLGGSVPKNMMYKAGVNNIDEISEVSSINRPGPLGSGLNEKWIDIKNGTYTYESPEEEALAKLFLEIFGENHSGLMVYQEDIMKLVVAECGFTNSESDTLRKSIGKKKMDLLMGFKEKFVNGWQHKELIKIDGLGSFFPEEEVKVGDLVLSAKELVTRLNNGESFEI